MKRNELIKHLKEHGCALLREGGSHTVYRNLQNLQESVVPRHSEINTFTALQICKDLGVPKPKGRS